ncbi:MAG TPA: protein phosphatase 2C domain-containing protein [Hyphomonadaceae bacterium]|nr:protein phosphatase 2C domain-containing protein [Hyphomonadaceae bacterium]
MKLIDSISFPGSKLGGGMKTGTGDDRYAFDEAAGWACVIDGATDVGPVRIFSAAESDAARYAEIFAAEIVAGPADAREIPQAWFARLLPRIRKAVEREVKIPLKDAPLPSYPTAAATWVRAKNGKLEGATLGDSIAIVWTPAGQVSVFGEAGKPADEQKRAVKVMAMTPEERLKWLQDVRAIHNTPNGYWVFGVQPEAAGHIVYQAADAPAGTQVLVMTDGFYRLVSPYGRYSDAELIEAVAARGLGELMRELRGMEASPEDDAKIGRFKTSDDATALLLEI